MPRAEQPCSQFDARGLWPFELRCRAGMSQKSVEIVIGRLATDEALRAHFSRRPEVDPAASPRAGLELTAGETEALLRTPVALWAFIATCVHPRLQKVALKSLEER